MTRITRICYAPGGIRFTYDYDPPEAHPVLDKGTAYTEREFWDSYRSGGALTPFPDVRWQRQDVLRR